MNDTTFQIWLGFMFFLGGSVGGCLVGITASAAIARSMVESRMPKFPEFIAVQNIDLQTVVNIEENGLTVRRSLKTSAADMSSDLVEQWLGQRDLMMTPKGKDFQVKAPKVGGGNALG
jgi:hypothetical protein